MNDASITEMGEPKQKRIEVPLLKAHILRLSPSPPYAIQWPGWASWVVFAGTCILWPAGFILAIVLAIASGPIVRSLRKPKNEQERADEKVYEVVRRLKVHAAQSSLRSVFPSEVVIALEKAASAHQASCSRVQTEEPVTALYRTKQLDDCFHACLMAAAPVLRDQNHSKKEWLALGENRALISSIVDSIDLMTNRMDGEIGAHRERLAALRELEEDNLPHLEPFLTD